MRLTLAIDIRS